jgi:hypothetical protein
LVPQINCFDSQSLPQICVFNPDILGIKYGVYSGFSLLLKIFQRLLKLSRGGSPESFRENLRPSRSASGRDTGLRYSPQIKQKSGKEKRHKKSLWIFILRLLNLSRGGSPESFRENLRPSRSESGRDTGLRYTPQIKQKSGKEKRHKKTSGFSSKGY